MASVSVWGMCSSLALLMIQMLPRRFRFVKPLLTCFFFLAYLWLRARRPFVAEIVAGILAKNYFER